MVLKGLGYAPEVQLLSVPVTYASLKNKDIDVFLGNWMPTMEGDIAKYREDGSVETVGANLEGAKYTLAVNKAAAAGGLKDAGFESGRLAATPLQGWYSSDVKSGVLLLRSEETVRVEGRRSLLLEVAKVKSGVPLIVSQAADLPAGEEFEFLLSLRSRDLAWVRVDVGVWENPRRFRSLQTYDHPIGAGQHA